MGSILRFIDIFLDFFGMATNWLLQPIHSQGTNRALTSKNLEANLRRSGVSQMLPYRIYTEYDGVGIYTGDGDYDGKSKYKGDKHGFILRLQGDAFPNNSTQEKVAAFLSNVGIEGVVVNFFNMSSQNIEPQIRAFEDYHHCKVNVKNISFLKKAISNRASILRRWTRESMFGKTGADFRLKEFVTLVSVLFPEGTDIDDVISAYGTLESSLNMSTRNCDAEELVTILREFFHNEKEPEDWMHGVDNSMAINKQIVSGGLKVDLDTENPKINFKMNDSTAVAVLTTKKFPKRIDYRKFSTLFYDRTETKGIPPISSPFISTLTLVYDNVEKTKTKATDKLTHDLEQLSGLSMKKLKKKPELKDRRRETEESLEAIKDGERILQGMFNIIVYDTNESSVQRSVDNIRSSFAESGWELVQETFDHTAFNQVIFSLPLQFRQEAFDYLERFDMLYRGNFSGIAPIISDSKGFFKNYHIPYFSATGQLQWFDPYASDTNYSIATAGDSGSGKSYTFADFALLNLAAGYQVRIIDSLPSYKRITHMVGGQYEDFTDKNVCANFFTNLLVMTSKDKDGIESVVHEVVDGQEYPVIDKTEMQTLIPIVAMLAGVDLKNIQEGDVDNGIAVGVLRSVFEYAIRTAWRRRGREAGMKEVYEAILAKAQSERDAKNEESYSRLHNITLALEPYGVEGGTGYSFLNGVNNIEMVYDLATFELTELEGQGVLYEVFLMLLSNKIVNEFFENKARPKCLIIDEFWRYKEIPIVLKFIEELARKARKASGFIVPITQAITDYYATPAMENVANSCAFRWILQQDPSVIEKATKKGILPYSNFLIDQIGKIHNNPPKFGEFAIMNGSYSLFSRLKTDRVSHWLYTTHPGDNQKMQAVASKFNITEVEASLFCAFKDTFPHATDDEALLHATTTDDDNWEKYRVNEDERNKKIEAVISQIAIKDTKSLELVEFEPKALTQSADEDSIHLLPFIRFGIDESLEPSSYRFILEDTIYSGHFMEKVVSMAIDNYRTTRYQNIIIDVSQKGFFMQEHLNTVVSALKSEMESDHNKNAEVPKQYSLRVDFDILTGDQTERLTSIINQLERANIGLVVSNPTVLTPIALFISKIITYIVLPEASIENIYNASPWIIRLIKENNIPVVIEHDEDIYSVPDLLDGFDRVSFVKKRKSLDF